MNFSKLTLLSAIMLIFISTGVLGQDYAFKVLANKGGNEIKSGEAWVPLKTGASLSKNDQLKVANNAYIGLVHSSGRPLEMKTAGTFKVQDLESKVQTGKSVLNKYTDFILSSNSAEAKKNRLSATGAVHRDLSLSPITVLLPPNQHSGVYNREAMISWDSKLAGPFVVKIRNMFDDELASVETTESSIVLDLAQDIYANENAVLVEVYTKEDPSIISSQHLIKKLTPSDKEQIRKDLEEIMGVVSEQTALNKFFLAGFYEQHNLFIDAIAAYEEAIKLAPEVPTYTEAYEEFLLRHGLKK